jgi:hypothetical protein
MRWLDVCVHVSFYCVGVLCAAVARASLECRLPASNGNDRVVHIHRRSISLINSHVEKGACGTNVARSIDGWDDRRQVQELAKVVNQLSSEAASAQEEMEKLREAGK